MKICINTALFALITAIATAGYAAGDPDAGRDIAAKSCQTCHGADGNGTDAQYPRLAGQYADYIERSLQDYRSGARSNPIMAGFAAGLSDQDIKDLAAWFSGQSGLNTPD
jgi:cytochrome c553